MSKVFATSDVASHNKSEDLYIIVDGDVYDLTKFQDDHPGMCPASHELLRASAECWTRVADGS